MGAKTWMLVYSNGDVRRELRSGAGLDRVASEILAQRLFPGFQLDPLEDGSLSWTNPPNDEIFVGCYGGVSIVAANEFALDRPSTLDPVFIDAALGENIVLHAMHSSVNWLAFATWTNGELTRSLSLSTEDGIMENIGTPLEFEAESWEGKQPIFDPGDELVDKLGFNFHPLSLGEEALRSLFGYQLEGFVDASLLDPEDFPLMRFKRTVSEQTAAEPPAATPPPAIEPSAAEPAEAKPAAALESSGAKPWWKFW